MNLNWSDNFRFHVLVQIFRYTKSIQSSIQSSAFLGARGIDRDKKQHRAIWAYIYIVLVTRKVVPPQHRRSGIHLLHKPHSHTAGTKLRHSGFVSEKVQLT